MKHPGDLGYLYENNKLKTIQKEEGEETEV